MKSWFFPAIVLAALFIATRLPALAVQFPDSDINLYALYAAEWQAAGQRGESFYALHRRRVQEEMAMSTPRQAAAKAEYQTIEYPTLAITLMALPAQFTEAPFDEEYPTTRQPRYAQAYVRLMFALDVAILLLVIFLVRRLFPAETPFEQLERCLVYVICTWPLYGVLYSRLDLGVALLVTAGLALMVCRVHWCFALAVLALAVHFKLMPIMLAPLWLFASLPARLLRRPWRAMLGGMAIRVVVLAAIGLAILAPYYLQDGPAVLEFVNYHKDRGIEIESTWATLLLPFKFLGSDWTVYHSHGSVNIWSQFSPVAAALAMPLMAGLVVACTALFVAAVRRRASEVNDDSTIAQTWPRFFASCTLLALLISIVANKVFSTQYVLWMLPLVPLIDFSPARRRAFFAATFAMCFLTMRIFPDCFVGDIVRVVGSNDGIALFDGPTAHGAFLLIARNAICLALTAALLRHAACGFALASKPHAAVPQFLDAPHSVC